MTVPLPQPCSSVEATLVQFAQPATFEAFNSDGTSAGVRSMSGPQSTPETPGIAGASIATAVIRAPSEETILPRLCFEPLG